MKQIIPLKMDVTLDKQSPIRTGAMIYSQDKNSAYFKIELTTEMDEVIVLYKGSDFLTQVEAEQEGDEWLAPFDHTLISKYDDVEAFVYGTNGDKHYDIGVARFNVSVSEIDKTIKKVRGIYFQTLEEVADEFRSWIDEYKESVDDEFLSYAEAEATRVSNEASRKSNEDVRIENEQERVASYDEMAQGVKSGWDETFDNLHTEKAEKMDELHDSESLRFKEKYDDLEEEYAEDLTKVTAQLAHKATKKELEVEKQRIDSFTKLEDGSTTGDAELIDGRIGVNGRIHDNIGGAIREQVSNVNNITGLAVDLIVDGNSSIDSSFLNWSIGTVHTNTGEVVTFPANRMVGVEFYTPRRHDISVVSHPDYEFTLYRYNLDGTFVGILSHTFTQKTSLEMDYKYRFVARKKDDTDFTQVPKGVLTFNYDTQSDKTNIISDYKVEDHYYNSTLTLYEYAGWDTHYFNVKPLESYEYRGYSDTGNTPRIAIMNDNTVISTVRPKLGINILSIPHNANRVGFPLKRNDVNGFRLYPLAKTDSQKTVEALEKVGRDKHVEKFPVDKLPDNETNSLAFSKSTGHASDNDYTGLVWSDGVAWRWVKDDTLAISATGYATMKVEDGELLFSNETNTPRQSASVTKLLSALVAIDYIEDYSETVTLTSFDTPYTNLDWFLLEGDVVSYETILNASLVTSDNNAANSLARLVGYKIKPEATSDNDAKQVFLDKMEEKATEIGMVNASNFSSTWSGVQASPLDLVKMLRHIQLNSPKIKEIWVKLDYEVNAIRGGEQRTWVINSTTSASNRKLLPEFKGGKTGSGAHIGAYAFIWEHKETGELYASALTNSNITSNQRFVNARRIVDEVYSSEL